MTEHCTVLCRYIKNSVAAIIVNKSKSPFKKIVADQNCDISPVGMIFATTFNAFYEQRLSCVFSVYAIRTAHADYFIIVTQ